MRRLPVDIVFHPSWWHRHYGIRFDRSFFFDPETRVTSDLMMRRGLGERFPDLELVGRDAEPRPCVGGIYLAAGYIISGMLGCEIRYFDDASPEVICARLSDDQVRSLKAPAMDDTPIGRALLELMGELKHTFGYVEGDINWEGIQNVALNLRGEQLFLDYYQQPEIAQTLLDTVYRTLAGFLEFMDRETGTTSISVNRIVRQVDPRLHLHSNCTVTMVSEDIYRTFLMPLDRRLAGRYQPYGIHFCGGDMHRFSEAFGELENVSFFDVGWGSDVKRCREALPGRFLSLRLNPQRVSGGTAAEIEADVETLLRDGGAPEITGLCCVNMDGDTPDENVYTIFQAAREVRSRSRDSDLSP